MGLSEAIHQQDVSEETLLNLADQLFSNEGYERHLVEIASKGMTNGLDNAVEAIFELLPKNRTV